MQCTKHKQSTLKSPLCCLPNSVFLAFIILASPFVYLFHMGMGVLEGIGDGNDELITAWHEKKRIT